MVAVKSFQADAFLKAVDRLPSAVLFYGTDAGLVGERASTLARRLAEAHDGGILRLDDADLDDNPDKIGVELLTRPMFGGRKVVRAATGRRINAASLKPLVEMGRLEAFLIVEAGSLRKGDALLTLFETAAGAAAVACFPDEARDLEGMVGEVLAAARMQIAPEARQLLVARLGADRALSRAEVEKLVLYARGKARIEEADVEAAVGRCRRDGARPRGDGGGLGPRRRGGAGMRALRHGRRGRAAHHRRPSEPLPPPAPPAQRPRRRPVPGGPDARR